MKVIRSMIYLNDYDCNVDKSRTLLYFNFNTETFCTLGEIRTLTLFKALDPKSSVSCQFHHQGIYFRAPIQQRSGNSSLQD